ncbi:sensor histidine kinase [Nakamurella lactea]|uniref:sensor histidine kinase n=1 Tax=Nakamurella lactea TaxID=459515 RepID=UPI00041AAC45|nr:PAS domain-containing sensor histidine kinase [Nakamurella lactea]
MSTLSDLLAEHTTLPGDAVAHLQQLVSEWQLLSDLSFSDLTMWVQDQGVSPTSFVCVAQVRPTTGPTAHADDQVSRTESGAPIDQLVSALGRERGWESKDLPGVNGSAVTRTLIPVRLRGAVIAVLARDTIDRSQRGPSALETAYLDAAESLLGMVAEGSFPAPEQKGEMHTGPRAGDGLLRLDPDGTVEFISPNALSAYHRLGFAGDVVGAHLARLTRGLIGDPFDAAELAARITSAVEGRPSLRMEIEARGATVLFRAMPLLIGGAPSGALVLVRDVTEVRRRDRALLSKDATIREIHHRVKNNLQTVAALLRLQARRSTEDSVRHALNESVRRVASIALVHETLSTAPDDRVDLDTVVDRLVPMLSDVAAVEAPAGIQRSGSFGVLTADRATPLVMVLTEVVQNALQHAYPDGGSGKKVLVDIERSARELTVRVIDDGQGLPPGFSPERSSGLGLQIVRTLVDAELGGTIAMRSRTDGPGTEVVITVPLRRRGQ